MKEFNKVYNEPNAIITVIGRDLGAISAQKVEGLLDYNTEEGRWLLNKARESNNFVNLLADESKIKTLVLMDSGKIYPSTFNLSTLAKRIYEATNCIDER